MYIWDWASGCQGWVHTSRQAGRQVAAGGQAASCVWVGLQHNACWCPQKPVQRSREKGGMLTPAADQVAMCIGHPCPLFLAHEAPTD